MSNSAAFEVVKLLSFRNETMAAAESCTGGGIGVAITDVPGSSGVFWGGVVSYSNEAKMGFLNVDSSLLEQEGAVSSAVAKAMAWGLKSRSGTDWTVSVTGLAGPGRSTSELPVGTVWIGLCGPSGMPEAHHFLFDGDRIAVRRSAADAALNLLLNRLVKAEQTPAEIRQR